MFVVRKPFKNYGLTMLPGSVVEPGNIKRFKTRVKDRYIVHITPDNYTFWSNYFAGKFGTALPCINGIDSGSTEVPPEEPATELSVKTKAKVTPAKKVVVVSK